MSGQVEHLQALLAKVEAAPNLDPQSRSATQLREQIAGLKRQESQAYKTEHQTVFGATMNPANPCDNSE